MKKLFEKAAAVLNGRTGWENKQRIYYQMRHDGLRRRNKPWPTAADLHFPLIDMNIRKAKPFWESQATSSDRLVSFVALRDQQQTTTSATADYVDFELKQNTNFEIELIRAIDTMLLRGRGVLKITVDPLDDNKIVCEAVDPLYIIMAPGADDFDDTDWFEHVQTMSVDKYRRNRRYDQTETTIAAIRGNKDLDTNAAAESDKALREGIDYSNDPETIILREHWQRTMGGWTVYTYSPQKPELKVRTPFGCPYKFRGKQSVCFFSFKTEVKEKGWYAPRGVAELNAPFETYACKLWNEKTDAMTFANRPVYTSENEIKNTANIRFHPGEYIPGNIKQVLTTPPAISFDQEIAFTRSVSEQVSMLPDFGIVQPGAQGETGGRPRTATENNRIANLQSVGTESNGKIFRMDLAKAYRHIWGLILQFKRAEMIYLVSGELKTLPEQALHDAYLIQPDGAPDLWILHIRFQRANDRLARYAGSPNVDQDELVRDSMAADDPQFAQRAFIPSNIKAATEAEDEAMEISILRDGFPAAVKPNEDHATRIHVLVSYLQKQSLAGAPPDPTTIQRIQEHLQVHWMYLRKLQPQAAKQLQMQIEQQEQLAHQQAAARAAAAPAAGGEPPLS